MRKTSNDYRKELNGFKMGIESTEAHIIEMFPEAIVVKRGLDHFKAKYITKQWIDELSVESQLNYIEAIEEHTASLKKHHQVSMY